MRLLPLFFLVACTPSLEEAHDSAASSFCTRAVECEWDVGNDYDDCVDELEDFFQLAWSEDDCTQGIEAEEYGECIDELEELNCDEGVGWTSLFGLTASFLAECTANEVCED